MAERTATIYERPIENFDLEIFLEHLTPLGLALENPRISSPLMLSWDGDQIEVCRSQLKNFFESQVETSFQLWYAEDHDLYVRIKNLEKLRVIELGMEGTTKKERRDLSSVLTAYFLRQIERGVGVGLVFDPEGVSQEYDWNEFFDRGEVLLQRSAFPAGMPALLLCESSLSEKLVQFQAHRVTEKALAIVSSGAWLPG